MAANNKQYLIPGYGIIDEKNENKQWLMPGDGVTDEEAADVVGEAVRKARLIFLKNRSIIKI